MGWLVGCRIKSDSPHVGLGPTVGVPFVGIFLRDPSPYLREFGENHGKFQKVMWRSAIEN